LTELQLAFSRDGFHWDRANRQTFIGASLKKESWERAYVHSIGGVCNIVGDKLYFYYTAFKGDETKSKSPYFDYYSGMYANAAVGLATLRRDGFASMDAGSAEKVLLTRPLEFSGSYLFVNADCPQGKLLAELCDTNGFPLPGFARENCTPIGLDSTRTMLQWGENKSLQDLDCKKIRIKFFFTNCKLYAFWISKSIEGVSGGATAAGGPGLNSTWDE
ncbi:MAG: hypothetical protein KF862_22480, partial [Chitinophagaceae bacterium]|nr:hypothetical protein [Chitinophagaceae bacterium]